MDIALVDAGQRLGILQSRAGPRKKPIDIAGDRTGFIKRQAFMSEGRQPGEWVPIGFDHRSPKVLGNARAPGRRTCAERSSTEWT